MGPGYDFGTDDYVDTEIIICEASADGSFTVPAGEIAKMTQSDILLVYAGRITTGAFEFEPTGSLGESATIELQVGVLEFQ